MENILQVEQLCKSYILNKHQNHVLRNVDLQVKNGEFVAIMGPSGSGKSTLLYTVSGMDKFNAGKVLFDGNNISDYNETKLAELRLNKMGFVFQQMHFLKNLSIYDNIILPAYMAKKKARKDVNEMANSLMHDFGIMQIAENNIYEVSGGELQRACIARALMNEPQILFADEPTGALNSSAAQDVMDMLLEVHARGTTILMVTHDVHIAAHAQKVLYICDGKIDNSLELKTYDKQQAIKEREKTLYNWLMKMGW